MSHMTQGGQEISHAWDGTAAFSATDRHGGELYALAGGVGAEPTQDGRGGNADMLYSL